MSGVKRALRWTEWLREWLRWGSPKTYPPFHAVVNAIAHIHIETPWLPEERFVAGGAAAVAVAGGLLLGIRLRFHNHTP